MKRVGMMDLWEIRAKAVIADADSDITQVGRKAGVERMDLLYLEGGEEFHSAVRVFLRHLA